MDGRVGQQAVPRVVRTTSLGQGRHALIVDNPGLLMNTRVKLLAPRAGIGQAVGVDSQLPIYPAEREVATTSTCVCPCLGINVCLLI